MSSRSGGRWSAPDELALAARLAIRAFSTPSCLRVLYEACNSSPRFLPSYSFLLGQTFAGEARGKQVATSEDVADWLELMRRRVPIVDAAQNREPLDPALLVQVHWDGAMWPVHPGALHDPDLVIERLRRYAAAADDILVRKLGYGIAEVVAIGLRAMTIQIAFEELELDPASDVSGESAAGQPSLAEFLLTVDGTGFPAWLDRPWRRPVDRRLRAATAASAVGTEVIAASKFHFDNALLIRAFGTIMPVPASLVLEAVLAIATSLLEKAGRMSASVAAELGAQATDSVAISARGLPADVAGPVHCGRSEKITCVLAPSGRRLIAVTTAAGTSMQETSRLVKRAKRHLAEVKSGRPLTIGIDDVSKVSALFRADGPLAKTATPDSPVIADDTEIQRVIIIDGPWKRPDKIRRGTIFATVDEWRVITSMAIGDPEEFWSFLDELSMLPGLRLIEGATVLGLWEKFGEQGYLFAGGPFPEEVTPVDPAVRWRKRAAADPFEVILRQVGLPGLLEWPFATEAKDGYLSVGKVTPYQDITICAQPAIANVCDAAQVQERMWTQLLGDAIQNGLRQLATSTEPDLAAGWQAWIDAVPYPVRLHWQPATLRDGLVIKLGVISEFSLHIGYLPLSQVTATPEQVHEQIGGMLWSLIAGNMSVRNHPADGSITVNAEDALADETIQTVVARFQHAWNLLPATVRFVRTRSDPHTVPKGLASRITNGGRARAQRRITNRAMRLAPTDRSPRTLAELLETMAIPAAEQLFREDMAQFDTASALKTAAIAVERFLAVQANSHDGRVLRTAAGTPPHDPVDDLTRQNINARTAADRIVEAIMARHPADGIRMDHRDWQHLLDMSSAMDYLANTGNLERAGLAAANATEPTSRELAFDGDAYTAHLLRAVDNRHREHLLDIPVQSAGEETDEGPSFLSWTAIQQARLASYRKDPLQKTAVEKALKANEALVEAAGPGLDEIFAILAVAAGWPCPAEIDEVSIAELVAYASKWSGLTEAALLKAAAMLTLGPAEARQNLDAQRSHRQPLGSRLAGRPLLASPTNSGYVIVLPRRVSRASKLLRGYVGTGQLPWPNMPEAVVATFKDLEQKVQRAFEGEVEAAAKAPGRILLPRLKERQAAAHGLQIPGEIDLLAIDPKHCRVFVIEAKAGHVPGDPEQILHDIIDYHGIPGGSEHPRWTNLLARRGKSYIHKLSEKADAVQLGLPRLLASQGIAYSPDWTVVGMFVTPTAVPAAYVPEPTVPFVTIEELAPVLDSSTTPAAGPVRSTSS